MKLSHSHFLILAASLFVTTSVVHAQEACDPPFDIFCTGTDTDVDRMFEQFLATIPDPANNATSGANNGTTGNPKNATAANPVHYTHLYRRDGCPAPPTCPGHRSKKELAEDIAAYFKGYVDNIKLIAQGKFDEGIFNQLKNAGRWCDSSSFFVQTVIEGLNVATLGIAARVCDCLYATFKPYENFDQFKLAILCQGARAFSSNCPHQVLTKIASEALLDLKPDKEAYRKKICDAISKSTAGTSCA
ncbi:hypothetical protein DFQ27_004632 [Actinomortierella ambigua]|uniref:Secreted protein n=1 Tax=Actinomortierella ambigua TaxID=1343610 RepID=A0A9P6Q328_9FUNG|nr:hypothetical protein DFQ27_004632 [Actinomortierella ambigua]